MCQQVPGGTLTTVRSNVAGAVVDTLAAYRRHCTNATAQGQLILPEALKLLPLYSMALTKCPALRYVAHATSLASIGMRLPSSSLLGHNADVIEQECVQLPM